MILVGISDTARPSAVVASRSLGSRTSSSLLSPDTAQSRDTVHPRASIKIDLKGRAKDTRTLHPAAQAGSAYIPCEQPTCPPPSFAHRAPSSPPRLSSLSPNRPGNASSIRIHPDRHPVRRIRFLLTGLHPNPSPFLPAGCGATPSAPLATRRSNPLNSNAPPRLASPPRRPSSPPFPIVSRASSFISRPCVRMFCHQE